MKTKIVAHRGYSEHYPENTLLAFQKAQEVGADKIELDVHFSADKRLVVHHDSYLGRTEAGEGLLLDKKYEELKGFDVGKWRGNRFEGLTMPLLGEVFQQFRDTIGYEIEFKGFGEGLIDAVLGEVDRFELMDRAEFTSFQPYLVARLKAKRPEAKVGAFVPVYEDWMGLRLGHAMTKSELILGKIDVAHCHLSALSPDFVAELRGLGILSHGRNCNNEAEIKKALGLGLDQITTNNPELAVKIRDAAK